MSSNSELQYITDVIINSEVAHVNKLSEQECDDLAVEIETWLKSRAESVEGLFNPDTDEQILAIPLKSLGK
ncbi:MAG: hypothetical protein AAF391_07570 [Bacteroidota bacterium]